jgi:Flp pilus assembly protein TadD
MSGAPSKRRSWLALAGQATLAAALGLSGCQLRPVEGFEADNNNSSSTRTACDGDAGATNNTKLATVQQIIADGKPYAALAELDAIGATTLRANWLRAEALRRIDRNAEAEALYKKLIGSCLEGRAQHGLGLTAARQGQGARALQALTRARQLLPTDPVVRNDLGYALLQERRWDDAQFEFLTVLDLAPQDPLASRNLVVLAFAQGKVAAARTMATRFKLDAATTDRLALQAASLMYTAAPTPAPGAAQALPPASIPPEPGPPQAPLTSPASDAS